MNKKFSKNLNILKFNLNIYLTILIKLVKNNIKIINLVLFLIKEYIYHYEINKINFIKF
jgi:hypothetical protein